MGSSRIPKRLFAVASLIVVQDLAFFAAISPLLPSYVDSLSLSETEAGVLTAAYPAGTLLMAIPAGLMASRAGPRFTVVCGLAVMGASSLAFGFADQIAVLDAGGTRATPAGRLTRSRHRRCRW